MSEKTNESFAARMNRICAQLQEQKPEAEPVGDTKSPLYTWTSENAWGNHGNFGAWGNFGSR